MQPSTKPNHLTHSVRAPSLEIGGVDIREVFGEQSAELLFRLLGLPREARSLVPLRLLNDIPNGSTV
jgi:hypothetical protein